MTALLHYCTPLTLSGASEASAVEGAGRVTTSIYEVALAQANGEVHEHAMATVSIQPARGPALA